MPVPGGWVGYTSYDTIRYVYKDKLRFEDAPPDDRNLPDISLGLFKEVVVFDQATKLAYVVEWISTRSFCSIEDAYVEGQRRLAGLVSRLQADKAPTLSSGAVTLSLSALPPPHATSNMTKPAFMDMIAKAKEHIKAGDIFQVVLGQRFERRTFADPFEVYRALRVVNPSPYMIYMQARPGLDAPTDCRPIGAAAASAVLSPCPGCAHAIVLSAFPLCIGTHSAHPSERGRVAR